MQDNNIKKRKFGISTICAIFCVCIMLTSMATAIDISNKDPKINSDNYNLNYNFLFEPPNLQLTNENSQDFYTVDLEGCLQMGKSSGEPMIPVKPISLLLPPMKTISNVIISGSPVVFDLNDIDLIGKPVLPYQNPVPFGFSPGDFEIDEVTYSTDAIYPGSLNDNYQIGYSRGYTIFNTVLNPVQYNPVKGELIYYTEMIVNIELKDSSYINPFFRNNQNDKEWVEKLVYNPDITDLYTSDVPIFDYPGGLCDPSEQYDYVIITTTYNGLDYWDTTSTTPYNWESLMDKHESDDYLTCTIVTIQDIDGCSDYQNSDPIYNDQQAHIREFCKDAYQDWGTDYIFIGGDDEWIRARHMDTNYEKSIDTDIYWSNLDSTFNEDRDNFWGEEGDAGFDLYAELFIGRITCDTPQDVSNWMKKSFYYADSTEGDYLDNAGFYGGDTGWDCQGDDFVDYCAIKGTDDWLGPMPHNDGPFPTWAGFQFGFETWNSENPDNQYDLSQKWTAEPPNPGWQAGGTSGFRDAVNKDLITLISGIAHANEDMALDVGSSQWESQYTNTKPFFVHDFGCHCGDMDAADDGVLHSMLFHSDTELAFGCVFNTCYGWGNLGSTNSSSAFQAKEFWSYFFDMENKSGDFLNWQFGKAQAFSKDRMAPTIGWDFSYGTWRAIIEGCLLFGDPAQRMKSPHPSEPPVTPDAPIAPSEWVQEIDCLFKVKTTDPEGDQILYLLEWGDGTMSEWFGPYQNNQEAEVYHSYAELGEYQIKVRARDIWGTASNWSEPCTITIIVNTQPHKPTIDGSKIVTLNKEYTYTISVIDPDNQDVYYLINWGSNNNTDWIGPYASGETVKVYNSWTESGKFTIRVKAKDIVGGESFTSTLSITVIKNKAAGNILLLKILERFADKFPILQKILNF
jgi:hypothetical protein